MLVVKDFFAKEKILKEVNSIFIVLVPKSPNATSLDQFRPISLCNFLYNIITKVLANRLKVVILDLVSPNQAAFIKERSIGDNIILAQEMLRRVFRYKGRGFCLKVDIRKLLTRSAWILFQTLS